MMKLTYNDIQYIIEQASKIIQEGGRVVTLPSNDFDVEDVYNKKENTTQEVIKPRFNVFYVDNPNEKISDKVDGEPFLAKDGSVRRTANPKHVFLEYKGETYELYETVQLKNKKGETNMYNVPPTYLQIESAVNKFSGETVQRNLKYLKDNFGYDSMSVLSFFMHLLNNPEETIELEFLLQKHGMKTPSRYKKTFYILELAFYYDLRKYQKTQFLADTFEAINMIKKAAQTFVANLVERYKTRGEVKIRKYEPESDFEVAKYPVTTYDPTLNNGKGGLSYDVLNSINTKYRGFFEFAKGKKVEYINLSSFIIDTASFLKKGETAKKTSANASTGIGNKMMAGDVNNPDVDMSQQDVIKGKNHTSSFFFNDNRTLKMGEDGKLYGTKEGDVVHSGNVLAEKLAEGMAYVVKEKMPNGVPDVILSIKSSGAYNKKTISKDYINNRDNMLYYLQNTFHKNVGNIKVAPDFFYKAGHLTEISKECKATPDDLLKVYRMRYFETLKKARKDEALMEKLKFVGVGEKNEIILDVNTGWCDFSFMTNEVERLVDENGNMVLRTFNKKNVEEWMKNEKFEDFDGWQIKSVPPYMRPYLSFWVKYSFDGTMLSLSDLKSSIAGSGSGNEGYDEADSEEKMRMDDDAPGKGILVFDDNFASGATLTESCRLLVEYFNINPDGILALTPGWINAEA